MDVAFHGQVVLITGAGSGLGRRLARELARAGAVVAAVDVAAAGLKSLANDISGPMSWRVADVGNAAALAAAVRGLEAELGPIDILIANAGIAREMSALNFDPADLEKQIRVNLLGVSNSIGAVLPGMLRRRRGQLVAVSSLLAYRGMPWGAGYCASKAGVNALMESLRLELAPLGITCTTICPGWIRTPLTRDLSVRKRNMISVERAAELVIRAVARRRSFAAFPTIPRLVLAPARWLPTRSSDALARYCARPSSSQRKVAADNGTSRKMAA